MTLNLRMPEQQSELRPRITVFGVGGAGGNAVDNMIAKQLEGAEFVVANTDAQALSQSNAVAKIQLGVKVTEGLGAGAKPEIGAHAAAESIEEIIDHLAGAHMCFITAGMGGGTGTGAAPVIAKAAREMGILTVGVVTKPFQFEGARRMDQAEHGLEELQRVVDTLIIIPNQNLFRLANEKTTFTEAFAMADDVLYQGVKGVTDLMVRPGIINLDFADIRSVMDEMGKAMMGTGEATGEDRAIQAAEKAIANPLLDEVSLKGARGVLINITGGHDLTLFELDEAANRIRSEVDADANIIVGSTLDNSNEGVMRVSVVATGIDAEAVEASTPMPDRRSPIRGAIATAASMNAEGSLSAEPDVGDIASEPLLTAEAPRETLAEDIRGDARFDDAEDTLFARPSSPDPDTAAEVVAELRAVEPAPVAAPVAAPEPEAPVFSAAPRRAEPTDAVKERLMAAVRSEPNETAEGEKGGRFAINSLIHRMTGGREEPFPARKEPVVQASPDLEDPVDAEERDRVEIPAFLRRQAN